MIGQGREEKKKKKKTGGGRRRKEAKVSQVEATLGSVNIVPYRTMGCGFRGYSGALSW